MHIFEVTCINKPNAASPHEHITHLGNSHGNWRLSRDSVVLRIEKNLEAFYVMDRASGEKHFLTVVREAGKPPYLRAFADGKLNDMLVMLPTCWGNCRMLG